MDFTFCLLRCILVPLLALYISISFAIAEIRNLFLCNEILAYLQHESGSEALSKPQRFIIKIGEPKLCAALLIVVYIFVMLPLLSLLYDD